MEQHIPQDEIRRIIINEMVKKRNSIVPVIGVDTIVYKNKVNTPFLHCLRYLPRNRKNVN